MNVMTPTRPTELRQRRVRLTRTPAAVAEARDQVRALIRAWQVPVDRDIAVLLTSDLVTSAISRGEGETVTLAIRCSSGYLRVDVYDTSRSRPAGAAEVNEPAAAQVEAGLVLVAILSAEWGSFRTPAGTVVYFTLAFQADAPDGGDVCMQGRTATAKGRRE